MLFLLLLVILFVDFQDVFTQYSNISHIFNVKSLQILPYNKKNVNASKSLVQKCLKSQ